MISVKHLVAPVVCVAISVAALESGAESARADPPRPADANNLPSPAPLTPHSSMWGIRGLDRSVIAKYDRYVTRGRNGPSF